MQHLLIAAAGGAIGAGLRHLVNVAAMRLPLSFPLGTLAINIVGSFVMGLLVETLARRVGASAELRLFVTTGILGGFTTFSAFSLDVAVLWERGAHGFAAAYVAASVGGAILALFAGLWLARSLA